jgi:hypothetical protein
LRNEGAAGPEGELAELLAKFAREIIQAVKDLRLLRS